MPGQEGDFGVLPGHTPLFAGLRTGTMWYRQGGEKHFLAVSVGFAEVLPDRVTVLAQVAERAEDLDEARAQAGMARAEEMLQRDAGGNRLRARAAVAAQDAAAAAGRDAARHPLTAQRWRRRGRARPAAIAPCSGRRARQALIAGPECSITSRPLPLPRADPDPRRPRPQGALPRIGPRLLLVVHQSAAAAADLHVRLHGGAADAAPDGHRAVRAVHVLRHPAVDLVLVVASRIVERADLPAAT